MDNVNEETILRKGNNKSLSHPFFDFTCVLLRDIRAEKLVCSQDSCILYILTSMSKPSLISIEFRNVESNLGQCFGFQNLMHSLNYVAYVGSFIKTKQQKSLKTHLFKSAFN